MVVIRLAVVGHKIINLHDGCFNTSYKDLFLLLCICELSHHIGILVAAISEYSAM